MPKRSKPTRKPATSPEPRAWYRSRRTLSIPGVGQFRAGQCALLTEARHSANRNSLVLLTPDTPIRIKVNAGHRIAHNGREHVGGDLVQCTVEEAAAMLKLGAVAIVEAAHRDAGGAYVFTMTRMQRGLVARPETETLAETASDAGL